MSALRRFLLRLHNFFRPGRAERELARELTSHLTLLEDEFQRQGMPREMARLTAKRASGGIEQTKELHRDARSFRLLDDAWKDVRYAARLVRSNPLFALTAALSLAIGIGATTTVFTVANTLLFRPPAGVADPSSLVDIGSTDGRSRFNRISYPNYFDVRQRVTTLVDVYGYQLVADPMSLGSLGNGVGAERIYGTFVTANYFSVLGVRPAAGRLFSADDNEQPGASPFVVLSHSFWRRRFNRNSDIVGQTLEISGHPYTVIGVAPDGFHGTSILVSDVWLPTSMLAAGTLPGQSSLLTMREGGPLVLGGRLKPGVAVSQAAAELAAIGRALEREYPVQNRGKGLRLLAWSPIPGDVVPVGPFLALLLGIVLIVLAVACANVAGLQLARASARRREIAVRLAIGAGRARLIQQLLTETMMLFVLGGAVGLLLARGMTSLLVSFLPTLPLPLDVSLPLDRRVFASTAALSLIAAVLSGLVPALQASKADVVSALKDNAQGPSGRLWTRNAFVVGQVALSIMLVICAGLLARALNNLGSVDPGFDPNGVELTSLDLSLAAYTDTTGPLFARALVDRVRSLPGVQTATMASNLPMGDVLARLPGVTIPGVSPPNGQRFFEPDTSAVEPSYFATMRIPLVAGRDFSEADRKGTQPVAIIGEAAAREFWPGQDAVGKRLLLEAGPWRRPEAVDTLLVIGVARDVKYRSLRDDSPVSFVYVPLQQHNSPRLTLVARTIDGQRITNEIRALVTSMNPNLPIVTAQTLEELTARSLVAQRVAASVSGSLGIVGLLLAAIGIYGVTAYAITRRTREIGIRIAVGASRINVIVMVLRQGMSLAVIGSAIGLVIAAAASRLLTGWLFGISPIDPVTFAGAAVLFAAVGLVACYVPARRATKIDAMEALRYE